jgi:hypothetical protein
MYSAICLRPPWRERPPRRPPARDGRAHQVDRVRGAQRLGEDVADAGELEHGADAAGGDDAGTGSGGLEQHAGGAEAADHLVRGGRAVVTRHGEQVLLCVLDRLLDRQRHLARLAVTGAHVTVFVTNDDQGREGEPPAALDDLGDAVDIDDALFELVAFAE